MLSARDRAVLDPPGPERTGPVPGLAVCLLASVASGVLLVLGTGLHPVWWLAWVAPVPVLVLAPRVRARRAAWVAALAGAVGMAGYARYLIGDIQAPPIAAVSYAVAAALVVGATTVMFRALVRRDRVLAATLLAPAAWAAGEYLVATLTSAGTNWTLADSQADDLPILQVVPLVGPWGVGFVMLAVAAGLAGLSAPGVTVRRRVGAATAGIAVLAAALAWGLIALAVDPVPAAPTTVSALAAPRSPDQPRADDPAGRALVGADLAWLAGSAPRGGLVVLPEKDLIVDDANLAVLVRRFADAVRVRSTTAVLGIEHRGVNEVRNEALVFTPGHDRPQVYAKRYLVPGVEDEITPGDRIAVVPGSDPRIGVAICADLGQASLGREYGLAGTGILAVPALDFFTDAWSQSRVQFMRGVENGFAVVRASRQGALTISDARGRVLAETLVDNAHLSAVTVSVASAPETTPYARWGDWFAWLCLAATGLAIAVLVRGRRATASR